MERSDKRAEAFIGAVNTGNAEELMALFKAHPELAEVINAPWFSFGGQALGEAAARTDGKMVDALIDLGADLEAHSDWKNGPYTALHRLVDGATPEKLALADHIADRGAIVDLHAAAGMGRLARIVEILDAEPGRINEPGPDGATALHLAKTVEVAELLIQRGADVDQRCVDHKSTPAMWATGGREDVMRRLLEHGATTDLYLAVLMDDISMAERLLEADPGAIDVRVRFGNSHPHVGYGDKYVWSLNGADTPVELARQRDKPATYALLLERSPPDVQLLQASRRADVGAMTDILEEHPGLTAVGAGSLSEARTCAVLHGSPEGARLLLERGVDANARDDQTGATALHHACWGGKELLARTLLEGGANPDIRDLEHKGTPLEWAHHSGTYETMASVLEARRP